MLFLYVCVVVQVDLRGNGSQPILVLSCVTEACEEGVVQLKPRGTAAGSGGARPILLTSSRQQTVGFEVTRLDDIPRAAVQIQLMVKFACFAPGGNTLATPSNSRAPTHDYCSSFQLPLT